MIKITFLFLSLAVGVVSAAAEKGFAKGVAQVGLGVAAPFIPGGTVVSSALSAQLKAASASLEKLSLRKAPRDLSKEAGRAWVKQSTWLRSVSKRYRAFAGKVDAAVKSGAEGKAMAAKMAAMNMQFLALQEAVQMESRKFQTLSNASKARHDIALNAIRNMK